MCSSDLAFANPRAGNGVFFQQFQDLECYRIANGEDIVPTLPLASLELTQDMPTDTTSEALGHLKLTHLKALLADLDFHHVGEPIYFSLHRCTIAANHIIPAYKEALDLPEEPSEFVF